MSDVAPRATLLAFTGKRGCGKSAVSSRLRAEMGLSPGEGDLEFSDLVMEVVNRTVDNLWLPGDADRVPTVRRQLIAAAAQILDLQWHPLGRPRHTCRTDTSVGCAECGLTVWVRDKLYLNPVVTRDNKLEHLGPLTWLGLIMREVYYPRVWADEITRRALIELEDGLPLVTIGGVRHPADAERIREIGGKIVEVVRRDDDDPDATAARRSEIIPDILVDNSTEGESALEELARQIAADLRRSSLQELYGPI